MKNKLYFIGYGHMAEAIYQRLDKPLFEKIFLIEKDDDRQISIDKKKDDELSVGKKINEKIEEMILKNPGQWIWTHNRWKV